MAYLAPIHRPTSVRHAIKLQFLTPDEDCLVVAYAHKLSLYIVNKTDRIGNSKSNRLELYTYSPDGLSLHASRRVYGKITMLQKLRPASSPMDHLFVGTDLMAFFVLSWDAEKKQLVTVKAWEDLKDSTAREGQFDPRCWIDPTGEFLTLEVYEGYVTTIPMVRKGKKKAEFEPGNLADQPCVSRIPELFARSSAFLHGRRPGEKPQLGILWEDYAQKRRLKIRELDYDAISGDIAEWTDVKSRCRDELDLGASHLIPLSDAPYGLLILSETRISYWHEKNRELIVQLCDPTVFVAWERVDNQRYVLADDYGKLYLLMLDLNFEEKIEGWKLDTLGTASRANVLVYMDAGRVFLGSHQGDSQLIRIQEDGIEIEQSFANLAPILDLTVMDMGNRSGEGQVNEFSSGQARLVTGSGAWQDGSLRSVRSGVGMEDLAQFDELEGIHHIFSLKSDPSLPYADSLLVCFVDHSRVFTFSSDGGVEEADEFKGLLLSDQTILAKNIHNSQTLQVTLQSVAITDLESGMLNSQWKTDGWITAVAATDTYILLVQNGVDLILLDILNDLSVITRMTYSDAQQISCVDISSALPNACVIGFYKSSSMSVLSFPSLSEIQTITISEESIAPPRSLLIARLFPDAAPTLLIGMGDGNVVSFTISDSVSPLSMKRTTILGTQEPIFHAIPRDDNTVSVFAAASHPTLIHASAEGHRIIYSAVNTENAITVCPFDAQAYPGAVAIGTTSELKIAIIDTERTTHVQTLKVGESVRRICYSPALKCFGLGTVKRTLVDDVEVLNSVFRLVDEVVFEEKDMFQLKDGEMVECVIRAELDNGHDEKEERFLVGTGYIDEEVEKEERGRLIIFEVTRERKLKVILEHAVKGLVRCLGIVEGMIVAACAKTVILYKLEYRSQARPKLGKRATFRCATLPIDMDIDGTKIAISDLMKSLCIVEYKPGSTGATGTNPDKLVEVARDHQTAWSTAVAQVAPDTWLQGDADGNLQVLARDASGVTKLDQKTLRITSEMHVAEMVNRIKAIDVKVQPNSAVVPRAFVATVNTITLLNMEWRMLTSITGRRLDLSVRSHHGVEAEPPHATATESRGECQQPGQYSIQSIPGIQWRSSRSR